MNRAHTIMTALLTRALETDRCPNQGDRRGCGRFRRGGPGYAAGVKLS
jgi:hypothetical protein